MVCTSTLAWGVNLPAHLVIIKVRQNLCGIFFIWFLYLQRFLAWVYCSSCSSGQIYVSVDSLAGNRILWWENKEICWFSNINHRYIANDGFGHTWLYRIKNGKKEICESDYMLFSLYNQQLLRFYKKDGNQVVWGFEYQKI